jgi:phospholipid transport system substrate-binding protein
MKKTLTFVIFLIIIISSIEKVYSIEADVFVQSTVNRAAKTLSGNQSKEARIEKNVVLRAKKNCGYSFVLKR